MVQKVTYLGNTDNVNFGWFAYDSTDGHPIKCYPILNHAYFWLEDGLSAVDHFDLNTSAAWRKATGDRDDDGSLLTLFLCVAAGSAPKTLLSEKTAATLVRRIRKSGLRSELVNQYILHHAPEPRQDDYAQLWEAFIEEAQPTLLSDLDRTLKDALTLLRRECNIGL